MKNYKLFLASPILVIASVLFAAPTVIAQSQLVNDLIDKMPCQASCQWIYNVDTGRLCESGAEFGCAEVGLFQCVDTAKVMCNSAGG